MKIYLKKSLSLFLRILLANVLSLIVAVSLTTVFTVVFSEQTGYEARGYISTPEIEKGQVEAQEEDLYTYYFKDGEDTKKSDYINQGYTVVEYPIYKGISSLARFFCLIIIQLLCGFLFLGFVYVEMWPLGYKDGFAKNPNKYQKDKLMGFKVGLLASIPNVLLLSLLTLFKNSFTGGFSVGTYKLMNSTLYSIIDVISNGVVPFESLKFVQILLLFCVVLILPLASQFWYYIGRRGIILSKKLMYKNKQKED